MLFVPTAVFLDLYSDLSEIWSLLVMDTEILISSCDWDTGDVHLGINKLLKMAFTDFGCGNP